METDHSFFNYVRLQYLVSTQGTAALRLLFRKRYKILTGTEWENGSKSQYFFSKLGSIVKLGEDQKEVFESGDIYRWDFTLLVGVLLSCSKSLTSANQAVKIKLAKEDEAMKTLRKVRNVVEHLPGKSIPNEEFSVWWKETEQALLQLEASEKEIQRIRTTSKLAGLEFRSTTVDDDNLQKARLLRKHGDGLVKDGMVAEAIAKYSEALSLFGLSPMEKSHLLSKRSLVYLRHLEDDPQLSTDVQESHIQSAMEDAEHVIQLRPQWWKGHFAVGRVYQIQKMWNKAIDSLENALSIKPNSKEIVNARDECRFDKRDAEIELHLDPLLMPTAHFESLNVIGSTRWKDCKFTEKHSKFTIKLMTKLAKSKDPEEMARGSVFMAHRYQMGDTVPHDLEMAADLFKRAAKVGSPEGTYNLGVCYLHGRGVTRSIPDAVRLIEKVANYQRKEDDTLYNIGISEGKFMLGKLYQDGVGKQRNYVLAADWYARSVLEENGNACNNLSLMYERGIGVERNLDRAMQYRRLAIEQRCPIAMHTLSKTYMEQGDLTRAKYWFGRAVESGYLSALLQEDTFAHVLKQQEEDLENFRAILPKRVRDSHVPTHILLERHRRRLVPDFGHLGDIHNITDRVSYAERTEKIVENLMEEDPQELEAAWRIQLSNPKRIIVATECRRRFSSWMEMDPSHNNSCEGKHTQKAPSYKDIPFLKEIRFQDMDPTVDRVYEGFYLNLTIMEEFVNGPLQSVHSIVKDDSHDFQLIYFYNLNRNDPSLKGKLGFGSRIRIRNPYLRLTQVQGIGIRVDDPKSIVYLSDGEENPICRYCWRKNPQQHCARCKIASYCSKECQTLDWKQLKHKSVCNILRDPRGGS